MGRGKTIGIYVSEEEYREIIEKAKAQNLPISKYLYNIIIEYIKKEEQYEAEIERLRKEIEKLQKENEKLKERLEKARSRRKITAWDRLEEHLQIQFPKELKDPLIATALEEEDFFITLNRSWKYIPKKLRKWIADLIFGEVGAEWDIRWKRIRIPKNWNEREEAKQKYFEELKEWRKRKEQNKIKSYAKPVVPQIQQYFAEELTEEEKRREMAREILEFLKENSGRVTLREFAMRFPHIEYEKTLALLQKHDIVSAIFNPKDKKIYIHLLRKM